MGFPDKALAPDEAVLLHTRPHARRLVAPVLVLFVSSALAGIAGGFITRAELSGPSAGWLYGAVAVLWSIMVLGWTIRPWLRWRSTHLVVTDLRIMFRVGILRRRAIDIPLRRINSVQYHQRLADRVLRSGVLTVESAGDDPLEFSDVPKIVSTHALILDVLDDQYDYPTGDPYYRAPE